MKDEEPLYRAPKTDRCPTSPPPAKRGGAAPSPVRVFVASAQEDWRRARAAMRLLRMCGAIITHDWTVDMERHEETEPTLEELRGYAQADYQGVITAHTLLVLTPDTRDMGCGVWSEIGIAYGEQIRIVTSGKQRDRCIYALSSERYASDVEAVEAVVAT